jgi:hypothetical protein
VVSWVTPTGDQNHLVFAPFLGWPPATLMPLPAVPSDGEHGTPTLTHDVEWREAAMDSRLQAVIVVTAGSSRHR